MKNIFLILSLGLLFGCNTPCTQPGSIPFIVSQTIVSQWTCNQPAVLKDVAAACQKLGFCAQAVVSTPTKVGGSIANVACPLIVGQLQNVAAGAIPPAWGCDSSKVGANFALALTGVCQLLPF